MKELIYRDEALRALCDAVHDKDECVPCSNQVISCGWKGTRTQEYAEKIVSIPSVHAVEIPETGIGDLSDGFHTFNGLYYQRLILFAALVKTYKDKAWKSWRHEDSEIPFGGGWFIVGIDTPEGSYTYHYEAKDWNLFDCEELPVGKHWDGHTEEDVTRLLSLEV